MRADRSIQLGPLECYTVDELTPSTVAMPSTIDSISETLAVAEMDGKGVIPWGGGTLMALGNLPRTVDLVLGLGRMNRLLGHEPEDLTTTVEAGISLASLQKQLALKGQHLPIQAPIPSRSTMGGILATNASGPSRLAYGLIRDWLIGIKVVHADGTVTKSGGKVVKNVTGYDLNKLYVGSLGTLGVIVEATFKVAPIPQDKCTLVAGFANISLAMQASQDLLSQSYSPQALHVLSHDLQPMLPTMGLSTSPNAILLGLFEGRQRPLTLKVEASEILLCKAGANDTSRLGQSESDSLWQGLVDLGWGNKLQQADLMISVVTPPASIPTLINSASALTMPISIAPMTVDPGFGMVRFIWLNIPDLSSSLESVNAVIATMRSAVRSLGGHLVVERCPTSVKRSLDIWGDRTDGEMLMRQLKLELDPAGILNPGRYLGGI